MSSRHSVQPGDRIEVMVGGKPRMTYIDTHGTQKFEGNGATLFVLKHNGCRGLNELHIAYLTMQITFEDYLEFYLSIETSVSQFAEMEVFRHLDVYNPLWDETKDLVLAPSKDYGINLLFPLDVISQEEEPLSNRVYYIYPAIRQGDKVIGCSDVGYEGFAVAREKEDGDWVLLDMYTELESAEEAAHFAANLVLTPHQKRLLIARKFL